MRFGRYGVLAIVVGAACTKAAHEAPPQPAIVDARPASVAAPRIDAARLMETIAVLADDAMLGRDSRNPVAIRAAADYLERQHRAFGTRPVGESYSHPFSIPVGSHPGDQHHFWVDLAGRSRPVPAAWFASLAIGRGRPRLGGAVYLGTADDASLQGLELRRKIAIVEPTTPQLDGAALLAVVSTLVQRGAAGLVLVHDATAQHPAKDVREGLANSELPVVAITGATAVELFPALRSESPRRAGDLPQTLVSLSPVAVQDYVEVPNVVAYLPGVSHPDEIVVIGAHFDHIGTKKQGNHCVAPPEAADLTDVVCNGADDNASGTAIVLELARLWAAQPHPPGRTLVFAHFAGEELGLLGSRALSASPPAHPPFTEGRVVAMLNFDMVGRYRDDPGLTIGAVSSSHRWEPLLAGIDRRGLVVHLERAVSNRSDHANYYRRNVPVLFFFTGLHPDYHRTTDELPRIHREGLAAIGAIALDVTRELARGAPIPFRAPADASEGETSRLPGSLE